MESREPKPYTGRYGDTIQSGWAPYRVQALMMIASPKPAKPMQIRLPRSRNSNCHSRQGRHEIRALVYAARNRQFRIG